MIPDHAGGKTTQRAYTKLRLGTQFRDQGEPTVAHPAHIKGLLELRLAGEIYPAGGGGFHEGREVLLLRRGEADGVEVSLFLPLEEPHAAGEGDEDAAGLRAG